MALFTQTIMMIIKASAGGAVNELKHVEGQAAKTATAWDKAGKKIGISGATLKGGLAAVAGSAVTSQIIQGVQQIADAYVTAAQGASMLSKVTNSSIEDASRFNAVASRMGLGMNDLVEIFSDFQQAAAKNSGVLDQMGVELAKNSSGQTDWIATAEDFMTTVQGIGDATQRNALMFQFFGEEGAKQLMGLLNAGMSLKEALDSIPDAMILHADDVRAAQDYAKSMTDLKNTFQELSITLGRDLVPALEGAAEGLQVFADVSDKLPLDFFTRAFPVLMLGLKGIGAVFGDSADAADGYSDALTKTGTAATQVASAQQTLTAVIASGATSGQAFAAAVAAAGDELAAQDANARLAAAALDIYRASTDQAYESTLKLLDLNRSERSAQRAAEGAADAAGDAKAAMDKALADANAAKTVVEHITAIQGRARKKREEEGIVEGSTDVSAVAGIKGRKASTKTRVIEAEGVITPAEARAIREATRTYEQSLDDIAGAWENLGRQRAEALGPLASEAEKLDEVRKALKEGLKSPGLSAESKAGIKADLAVVEAQIKKLGGVPIEIQGIKFKSGTTKGDIAALNKQIAAALDAGNAPLAHELQSRIDALVVKGPPDLKATLGLDEASVAATKAALANVGIDPKTGKPYTAKTTAKVDKTQAQKDLDALTKPRTIDVTVNLIPGTGGANLGGSGTGYPAAGPRLNFGTAQQVSFSPQVTVNYPKPERASDSIASALRISKYMVGV